MSKKTLMDESMVHLFSAVAGLPLGRERCAAIAPWFSIWVADANELNRKMSQARFWEVTPAIGFRHSATPAARI